MLFSDLSPQEQHLVRKMWKIQYGSIENLGILSGQPAFNGRTRILRDHALDRKVNLPKATNDFTLKSPFISMFEQFHRIHTGIVAGIRIQDGLPVRMKVEEPK